MTVFYGALDKLIAKIFYLREFIETWGNGIQTMMDSCKAQGTPVPQFSEQTHGICVTFKFAEPIGAIIVNKNIVISDRQREIINLLKKNNLNSIQISEKLKKPAAVRTVQVDLLGLEKAGLIKRQGKARAMIWVLSK